MPEPLWYKYISPNYRAETSLYFYHTDIKMVVTLEILCGTGFFECVVTSLEMWLLHLTFWHQCFTFNSNKSPT
jgi:hypothetical protein